ncbi:Glycosyltransferase, GT2 family [Arenibacter palladensis]|uniref:Glycosyltransferase, GT2 family n=1 Tax=Arenibacter palladensis TaxID=237373 RepID=A0A1M5G5L8_9FLAO|nr:glycosyltransferase [Arenibacter palladensis]SHF98722.1 Glycosyltransferase, GT2 family [Arenibacter palladensis]
MKRTIAVLLTCHNRVQKTLECLEALFKSRLPQKLELNVFLVDDGSTDGTCNAVTKKFPVVNIIHGTGSLYWNQGMRLAWRTAASTSNYDFYLWLNDDTILDKNALSELLMTYEEAVAIDNKAVVVTGACRAIINSTQFSYGGRLNNDEPVIPNGKLQECVFINGNAVLVPNIIFKEIGNLSNDYTHGIGDNDYGLQAINRGFSCYTTKAFIATCPPHVGPPGWCNPDNNINRRWQIFHSPLGLNIKEYKLFRKKFWGKKWIMFVAKAYVRMLFPKLYHKINLFK